MLNVPIILLNGWIGLGPPSTAPFRPYGPPAPTTPRPYGPPAPTALSKPRIHTRKNTAAKVAM